MIMYKGNFYSDYKITSQFSEDRSEMYAKYCKNGRHEGVDYGNSNMSKIDIINLIDGVVVLKGPNGEYGNAIRIKHNPTFIGGINDTFFSQYCHLDHFEDLPALFVKSGDKLGVMGNTGHSLGVHLHLMMFQENGSPKIITPLLADILEKLSLQLSDAVAFWQFGRLFYNPEIIKKYFLFLQEKLK